MTAAITNSPKTNDFFGTPEQLDKAIDTMNRVQRLYEALPANPERRNDILTRLNQIGENTLQMLQKSPDKAKEEMQNELKKLGRTMSYVYKVPADAKDLKQFAKRLLKDLNSISYAPMRKTERGLKGPTLLVDYPRLVKESMKYKTSVLKYTNENEIGATRCYQKCSEILFGDNRSKGFLVPKCATLNFENNAHESTQLEKTSMDQKMSEKLKGYFSDIKMKYKTEEFEDEDDGVEDNQVMIFEKIKGENLFDFARTKYSSLTMPQKISLFQRLGQLAMLDIVIGNLDRLAGVLDEGKEYALYELEANLGNIMVHSPSSNKELEVYAIDNGIAAELLDPNQKEKYHEFLAHFISSPYLVGNLSRNLIATVKSGLSVMQDDLSKEAKMGSKEDLETFSQDLDSIGFIHFQKGIQDMHQKIQERLIPAWNSEECKNYFSSNFPQMYDSIKERLALFSKN